MNVRITTSAGRSVRLVGATLAEVLSQIRARLENPVVTAIHIEVER